MTGYEFCIVRYVHSVATQEFVNVGVILWVPTEQRLFFRVSERYARLSSFFSGFDGPSYRQTVRALARSVQQMAEEINGQGHGRLIDGPQNAEGRPPDGENDIFAMLLKTILPTDASIFQLSPIRGGLADEPARRLDQLAEEFVERFEMLGPRERKDEAEIVTKIETTLRFRGLLPRLETGVEMTGPEYSYRFKFGWMNGARQVMEPISFDYIHASDVIEKANNWSGKLLNLSNGQQFSMTGVVSAPSRRDLVPAFERAVRILQAAPNVRRVVQEDQFDEFANDIERDLAQH